VVISIIIRLFEMHYARAAENFFICIATVGLKVKEIEKQDSVLTPKQQIDRLTRPGATYFNLNPFDVRIIFHCSLSVLTYHLQLHIYSCNSQCYI